MWDIGDATSSKVPILHDGKGGRQFMTNVQTLVKGKNNNNLRGTVEGLKACAPAPTQQVRQPPLTFYFLYFIFTFICFLL